MSATGQVAIREVDPLDRTVRVAVLARREFDDARALALAEVVVRRRVVRRAAAELDRQIDQLEVGVGDDDREAAEPALATTDSHAIAILAAVTVDHGLAEQRPAAVVEHRRRRRLVAALTEHLHARVAFTRDVPVAEVDVADRPVVVAPLALGELDDARALTLAEEVRDARAPGLAAAERDREVDELEIRVLDDER